MSLNTTPRDWAAGEVVTAAMLNAEIRDAILGLQAAWTSYTPTLGGWTLGNGTLTGKYHRVGKTILFKVGYTIGATDTISGGPTFTIPATSAAMALRDPIGQVTLLDNSASAWRHWFLGLSSTTTVFALNPDGTGINTTVPWTWAAGDRISLSGAYEAA